MDEDEDLEPVALPSRPWSWPWMFEALARAVANSLHELAQFVDEGIGSQMAMMHNRKIDTDDAKGLASDVLADLGVLPTGE